MMVIGNSFGGWAATEMTLRDNEHRIASVVLLYATGMRPDRADQITDIADWPRRTSANSPSTIRRCAPNRAQ
jgi:pimeloyl-ACP methyl ester carboxylesterase